MAVVWIAHKRLRLHKLALASWFVATLLIGCVPWSVDVRLWGVLPVARGRYPMAQEALALKRISAQAKMKLKRG